MAKKFSRYWKTWILFQIIKYNSLYFLHIKFHYTSIRQIYSTFDLCWNALLTILTIGNNHLLIILTSLNRFINEMLFQIYLRYILHQNSLLTSKILMSYDYFVVWFNFPKLQNHKGVQSFLGLAGYYRRFITNFEKISKFLTRLLQKD